MRVRTDFPLVDNAAFVAMQELNGILDRENVLVAFRIDLVDHGGQCRRFSAAGRPGDQDEASWLITKLFHDRRQIQALKSLDFKRDETEHGSDRAALCKHVGAEPAQIFNAEGKIYFPFFFELMFLTVRHHAVCESFGVRRIQRLLFDGAQLAVDANLGRDSRRQMKVRSSGLYGLLEHFGQCAHCFLSN